MSTVPVVSPADLKAELDGGATLTLVDVREANELEISRLPGVIHIPLGEIEDRFAEIPTGDNIVMICRSGGRSDKAGAFLMSQGYENVRNMATGMNGWATTVDPSMETY
jgi:sulfur-carrier protein adenylyltransferase/sulfurtransferase